MGSGTQVFTASDIGSLPFTAAEPALIEFDVVLQLEDERRHAGIRSCSKIGTVRPPRAP